MFPSLTIILCAQDTVIGTEVVMLNAYEFYHVHSSFNTLDENAILICYLTIISFAYSFMMSKNVIVFALYGLLSADAIMMCSLFISL